MPAKEIIPFPVYDIPSVVARWPLLNSMVLSSSWWLFSMLHLRLLPLHRCCNRRRKREEYRSSLECNYFTPVCNERKQLLLVRKMSISVGCWSCSSSRSCSSIQPSLPLPSVERIINSAINNTKQAHNLRGLHQVSLYHRPIYRGSSL